ncbi:MAG: hypothetical protein Q9163_006237, partial [Psora crenata]
MGKLIKNHWARLIILTAATYQILAAVHAFFWPKLFFDFLTTNLDPVVRPTPILQIINLLLGFLGVGWEWPLPIFINASANCHSCGGRNALRGTSGNHHRTDNNRTFPHPTRPSPYNPTSPPSPPSSIWSMFYGLLAGMHRSIEARLVVYPLSALAALLLYQGTNAGLYYLIGMGVYFWAFSEGEVIMS